jgi:ferrous iron transport protein B
MATVTTRIMDTKKEKIILSILLTLAVPCSAQLGAILGMAAGMSWRVWVIWIGVVGGTMMLVGWGAARVLPGSRSPFLVELPPLRMPKLGNILKKVKMRLKWYIKEVIPLFVLATFVLFTLDKLHLLTRLTRLASPLVVSFLGLPERATEAFLIGFFRRDYGAAGFFQMAQAHLLDPRQVAVAMVVITLFMPCVAHLLITIKERGMATAAWIFAFVMGFALAVGGGLNWALLRTGFL